jgi:hypothetical protein
MSVKRIDKLTKEQVLMMKPWADKWIKIGLQTGETDWDTFDKYMPICYEKAGLKYPKRIIRVSSPLVGVFASSIAAKILNDGAVDIAVNNAVGDAVRDAVRDAVDIAVNNAVSGAVSDAVREKKLIWHYWLGGQFWVGGWYWYGSPSVSSFFIDICKLKLSKDIEERAIAYQMVCQSVNYIWPNKDFVMVCARPKNISRDERGQLHSDIKKAIEYPDGWGLYILHGVKFDKELWEKVVNKKLSFKEVSEIKDIDQRTQAMNYCPPRDFLKEKGKFIEKSDKGNELWLIQKKEGLFRVDAYFLLYKDPSTGKEYMSGIDPKIGKKENADDCMAWKHHLTMEEYNYIKKET